jgi:hypothetical protein
MANVIHNVLYRYLAYSIAVPRLFRHSLEQ